MDYFREVAVKSFWNAWSLIVEKSVPAAMIGLAIYFSSLLFLVFRHEPRKARLRLRELSEAAIPLTAAFIILWGLFFVFITPRKLLTDARKELSLLKNNDLRISVISYGYDAETHELYSDVQYVNNGQKRRTILGVALCFRARGENGEHPLTRSSRHILYGGEALRRMSSGISQSYKLTNTN
jgi:hypothetical protein